MARIAPISSGQVTGSDNFFVKNQLDAEGVLTNQSGSLILSSSNSQIYVSGNLWSNGLPIVSGTIDLGGLDTRFVFTSSFDSFTGSFSGSVGSIGDIRYVLTSSYGPFTASLNEFSQSINSFTSSINLFSSSITAQVNDLNTLSQSLNTFTASINNFTSSINIFTSSMNEFSASVNAFTASLNFDTRYILTASLTEQRISSSIVLSGGLIFPGSDTNYHINAKNSHLILSSSAGSTIAISGNLKIPVNNYIAFNGGLYLSSSTTSDGLVEIGNTGTGYKVHLGAGGVDSRLSIVASAKGQYGSIMATRFVVPVGGGYPLSPEGVQLFHNTLLLPISAQVIWNDRTDSDTRYGINDVGIGRSSPGVIRITNGSSGSGSLNVGVKILNSAGHLILSSSAGSTVTVSGNLNIGGQAGFNSITTNVPTGTSQTINCDNGNAQVLNLASTSGTPVTVDFSNLKIGGTYVLKVIQHASVARTITWTGVTWTTDTAVTISNVLSSVTIVSFFYDGTILYGSGDIVHATLSGLTAEDHPQYTLTSSFNSFTSSFSASVGSIGDTRYVLTGSTIDQRIGGSIALSGGLIFSETNKNYHIKATNSHLILSSSLGSIVCVSGNLQTNGFRTAYSAKTSQYTVLAQDYFISADATGGSFGLTLPTAVNNSGKQYVVKKIDASANAVVVSGSGAETIDGSNTVNIVSQYDSMSLISNGANWYIY